MSDKRQQDRSKLKHRQAPPPAGAPVKTEDKRTPDERERGQRRKGTDGPPEQGGWTPNRED